MPIKVTGPDIEGYAFVSGGVIHKPFYVNRIDARALALELLRVFNEDPAPIVRGNGAYSAIVDDAAGDTGLAR